MKYYYIFVIASLVAILNISQSHAVSNPNPLLTYEDQFHGFKFEYPAHWDQYLDNNSKNTGVAIDLENFTHFAPSGVSVYTDRFQENREKALQAEPEDSEEERPQQNMTLKQYMQDFIYSEYCCVDYKSIKFNNSTLGGLPSMNVSWNHVDANKTIIGKNWLNFAIKDGVAYVIYYYTPTEESFNKFLPDVKSIINSFQVIPKVEPVSLPLEAFRYLV